MKDFNHYLKIVGGISILAMPFLYLGLIWFNELTMLRLIATNFIIMITIFFLDKLTED